MRSPFSFIKSSGGAVFNPATLALTGWWRASFSASPWVGVASAGTSGTQDLTEATNPPGTRALNGLNAADFDGSNDQLSTATATLDDFLNAAAWSAWCLFYADAAAADAGAGSRYNNPQFICDQVDGYFDLGFSDAGVHVVNNAVEEVVVACATGGWHLAQAKFDGTTVKLRVDGGARSTTPGTNIGGLTRKMRVGARYNAGAFFNGAIADLGLIDSALSDGNEDNILAYIESRYALSL